MESYYPLGALLSSTNFFVHNAAGIHFLYSIELFKKESSSLYHLTHPPYGSYHAISIYEFRLPFLTHASRLMYPFTATHSISDPSFQGFHTQGERQPNTRTSHQGYPLKGFNVSINSSSSIILTLSNIVSSASHTCSYHERT